MPRIIAGALGGRPIPGPPGKGTRPTSDRVREALFSRLEGWDAIAGARVLDLYAGTGALAFEALSRGASSALLVEAHGATARQLRSTASALGIAEQCEVRAAKAEQVAAQLGGGEAPRAGISRGPAPAAAEAPSAPVSAPTHARLFSLVFLDPPYDLPTEQLEEILEALRPALSDDALVVIERSSRSRPLAWPQGWQDDGTKSYGETVLQYGGPAEAEADTEADAGAGAEPSAGPGSGPGSRPGDLPG